MIPLCVSLCLPSSQPADAGVQHVRPLCQDEAAVSEVLRAAGHSGRVPVHEGPAALQHQ